MTIPTVAPTLKWNPPLEKRIYDPPQIQMIFTQFLQGKSGIEQRAYEQRDPGKDVLEIVNSLFMALMLQNRRRVEGSLKVY